MTPVSHDQTPDVCSPPHVWLMEWRMGLSDAADALGRLPDDMLSTREVGYV